MKLQEKLRLSASENPKTWILIAGVGVVGVAAIAVVTSREINRRKQIKKVLEEGDFDGYSFCRECIGQSASDDPISRIMSFERFEIKGRVTGFGSKVWKKTHEEGGTTAVVITTLLRKGSTCVGSTVLDQFSFGITGENAHYGTPINPLTPQYIPGGSSSGSAVAVAAQLAEFALGIDTIGGVRIPAAFCGVFGFRPSHRAISMIGVLPNSQSLDTVGWFARDPSILHRVGHVLLPSNSQSRRSRRFIFADDLFELSKVPKQKSSYVVSKATESLSGYQSPRHVNMGEFIGSNVPSLTGFLEESSNVKNGVAVLKALALVMDLLNRYEFKTNHEEWFTSVKLKLPPDVSGRVRKGSDSLPDKLKNIYKVKSEMYSALQTLLKEDGILVLPTVADPPLKCNSRKGLPIEFYDRALVLSSLSSMSGCCQVAVPLGEHSGFPISVSFIASHGADKFLLDTIVDCYPSLRQQASLSSESLPVADANDHLDAAELLKEKGNSAYKGRQWNKAVNYYTEAIKLNDLNATYYSNRAAAYLELASFQKAEEDCSKAISLDKKNVKAYLRRGTSRESLLRYKDAAEDFKHALVLEPQNKVASVGEKRLKKLLS
ncbi:hypothetical protein KSS87_018599 [Heliosperma pusillum]|nr:hypothetical protein KSS87_018599 [Heliosperma pusillum]